MLDLLQPYDFILLQALQSKWKGLSWLIPMLYQLNPPERPRAQRRDEVEVI